jgi:hypothetical protein
MKTYIPAVLLGLLVALIWGYFADLRNGQVEWFFGRLVFIPFVLAMVQRVRVRHNATEQKGSA